jgi:hypothetical protein
MYHYINIVHVMRERIFLFIYIIIYLLAQQIFIYVYTYLILIKLNSNSYTIFNLNLIERFKQAKTLDPITSPNFV